MNNDIEDVDYSKDFACDKKILVTASSNNAVNVLTERLIHHGVNVVRIVADERYDELSDKVLQVTLLYKAYDFCKKNKVNKNYEDLSQMKEILKIRIK
ncbi:hypothetical protein EIN_280260, partial [Entamoeba invadens IP1]